MKKKNMKKFSMVLAALMVAGAATGCAAKTEEPTTSVVETSEVATVSEADEVEKLDEKEIKDIYNGIDDVYVKEGAKDVDYLDGVTYDSSVVKDMTVDSSEVDATKAGTYKITYRVVVDRHAFEHYKGDAEKAAEEAEKDAEESSADATTGADVEATTETTSNDEAVEETAAVAEEAAEEAAEEVSEATEEVTSESAHEDIANAEPETVEIEKEVTVVDETKAQELADQDKPVYVDKNETVKKSDGSEVVKEEKAPASTAITNGTVINASTKEEVVPETTAEATTETETEATTETETEAETVKETEKETAAETMKTEETTAASNNSNNSGNTANNNSNNNSSSGNSGNNGNHNGNGGNNGNSGSGNSNGNSNGNGNNSGQKETQPVHVHAYTNHMPAKTGTRKEQDGTTTVVDKAAWTEVITPAYTEQVKTGAAQECVVCGYITTDPDDMDWHMLENAHSCHTIYLYETVEHEAVVMEHPAETHQEPVYKEVTYTIEEAYDYCDCGERRP